MAPPTSNQANNIEDGHIEGNEVGNRGNTIANQHQEALTALAVQLVSLLAMGTNTPHEGGKTSDG
jgi:hypothetical protein